MQVNVSRDVINVLFIGYDKPSEVHKIKISESPLTWADNFNITPIDGDAEIWAYVSAIKPQVIVTFGDQNQYVDLYRLPLEIRRKWIHKDSSDVDPSDLAYDILTCFVDAATIRRFPEFPLVSVFTPAYNSPDYINRLYNSIKEQTYTNWEWIVYDDSTNDDVFNRVCQIKEEDPRVHLFRSNENCGVIGEIKRRCCGLASGQIFLEADHDDELVKTCLQDTVEAFNSYPDAGFAYTDCAVVFDDGMNATYGESYAFGFGSYRTEFYNGRDYLVTNYPSINSKTVRHIVGMPNHIRAWTRDAYHKTGGYSGMIHVADDYELCLRTFLTTRMIHVQRFGYIQYDHQSGSNTHKVRNKEIQRLVAAFAARYGAEIHNRFLELGVDDFIYRDGYLDWSIHPENTPIANYIFK